MVGLLVGLLNLPIYFSHKTVDRILTNVLPEMYIWTFRKLSGSEIGFFEGFFLPF